MFQGFKFFSALLASLYVCFLATFGATHAFAGETPPSILFEKSYDLGDYDFATEVSIVSEGYLMGSAVAYFDRPDRGRFWILVDFNGEVVWQRTVPQVGFYQLLTAVAAPDGDVVSGFTTEPYQIVLSKRDFDGNTIWSHSYDPGGWGGYPIICKSLADGGFLILGTVSGIGGDATYDNDIMLVRTDAEGNQDWLETYGLPGRAAETPIYVESTDGGFLILGNFNNVEATVDRVDAKFITTDERGQLVRQESLGVETELQESVTGAVKTPSGNFVAVGSYGDFDYTNFNNPENNFARFIVELDSAGNVLWRQQSPLLENDVKRDAPTAIGRAVDGGYLIAGSRVYQDGRGEQYLDKIDRHGQVVWTRARAYSSTSISIAAITEAANGQYGLVGSSTTKVPYSLDTHLMVTAADGKLFVRGDSNGDGQLDISDPIRTLNYLFAGGVTVACQDAADANDDGGVDISDAVYSLNFLFAGGKDIPPPISKSGMDPTDDTLGCGFYYSSS